MGYTMSVPIRKIYLNKILEFFDGGLKIPNSEYPLYVHCVGSYAPDNRKDLICFDYSSLNEQGHHFLFTLCRMLALHFGKNKTFKDVDNNKYSLPYYFYDSEWFPVPYKPIIKTEYLKINLNGYLKKFKTSEENGYIKFCPFDKTFFCLRLSKSKYKKQNLENKTILEKIIKDIQQIVFNKEFIDAWRKI